jgi:hypothetical protein
VPLKWVTYLRQQRLVGSTDTLRQAQRRVERPYVYGHVLVQNETTGEEWERRKGTWIKVKSATPLRPTREKEMA